MTASRAAVARTLAALVVASALAGCARSGTGPSAPWGSRPRVELASRVSTELYLVRGTTAREILGDMRAAASRLRPAGEESLADAVGWVTSDMRLPSWLPREAFGGCVVDTLSLQLTQTIHLPRHAEPERLSPEVRRHWEVYAEGVRVHEHRHVEINLEGFTTIQAKLQALRPHPSCAQLIQVVDDIWRREHQRILDAQETFHRDEDARRRRSRAPLEAEIDVLRQRREDLARQSDAIAQQRDAIKRQGEALEPTMRDLRAQHQALANGGTSRIVEQNALAAQHNALAAQHRALVEQQNALVAQQNDLARESNRLVALLNALAEELDWSR